MQQSVKRIQIGIVGGTGYTGVELLRLLALHPHAEVCHITSRSEAGRQVADLFPNLRGHYDLAFSEPDDAALNQCDLAFFATPHGVAQSLVPAIANPATKVIDLSADFRIKDVALWEQWYGQKHGCPELIEQFVYGLPELNRDEIREARYIACPGCYPTSVQLGFLPLLEKNLVDPLQLIANSASGASGAGRQAKVSLLHTELTESFSAYGVAGHRHLPEIEQGLNAMLAGSERAQLTFVPHLLPMSRGIHSTLYARLKNPEIDLQALYEARYLDEPFVDVLPAGQFPNTASVRGTNVLQLSVQRPQERDMAVILVTEDNLTKGASGQAIQSMNIQFGLDERCGLEAPALLP